jgi:hypothetical protein
MHERLKIMAWQTNSIVQNANTTLVWTLSGGSLNAFDTIEVGQLGGAGTVSILADERLPGNATRLTVRVNTNAVAFAFRGGLV